MRLQFESICRKNELDVSDEQIRLIEQYVELLLEWNKKINLISRLDEENVWSRHIIGSISFLFMFRLRTNASVVDIGTGGGLPGIPIAVLFPGLTLTLIDSTKKKITAVTDIINRMGLTNVRAVAGRAEELASQEEFKQQADYLVARAVAPIRDVMKWGIPFLRPPLNLNGDSVINPGSMILLKGGELTTELEAAKIKFKPRQIEARSLIFKGVEDTDLIDKKIVIIQP